MCVKVFKYWPQPRLPELRLEYWRESAQYVLKLAECKRIQPHCHGVDDIYGFHGIRGYMESIDINGHPCNSRRCKMMPGATQSRRCKVDDANDARRNIYSLKRCKLIFQFNQQVKATMTMHRQQKHLRLATWNKCVLLPECGNTRMWENQPSV